MENTPSQKKYVDFGLLYFFFVDVFLLRIVGGGGGGMFPTVSKNSTNLILHFSIGDKNLSIFEKSLRVHLKISALRCVGARL